MAPVWKVLVNGELARALAPNFAQWEAVLAPPSGGATTIQAHAVDAAGNIEPRPHVVAVP
jgi:hypothetical protein